MKYFLLVALFLLKVSGSFGQSPGTDTGYVKLTDSFTFCSVKIHIPRECD